MMTFWSGFLLLLWVTYSYQKETGHLSDRSKYLVKNPLDSSYTKPAIVKGSISDCYKNFTNLVYDESYVVAHFPPYNIETCLALCQQTENCSTVHLIYGIDYTRGCTLVSVGAPAEIAQIYSGDIACNTRTGRCTKWERTFDSEHRIFLLPNKTQNYPGGKRSSACKKYCRTYSGNNGFRHEDIDWEYTRIPKEDFPDGKVPCAFYTYYRAWNHTCLIYTKGARSTPVGKIAGPTSKCEERRLKKLDDALRNPNFFDYEGLVYSIKSLVRYEKYVDNPSDCKKACTHTTGCHFFISINGLPYNSGCYLFNKDATLEEVSVKSGPWDCSSPNCLTDYSTYGKMYEIVLLPEYEFNGSGIENCQKFCKNHNGNKNGFQFLEVYWHLTGLAVNMSNEFTKCGYYTYIDKPWFGKKQCILFAEKAKPHQVWFRGSDMG